MLRRPTQGRRVEPGEQVAIAAQPDIRADPGRSGVCKNFRLVPSGNVKALKFVINLKTAPRCNVAFWHYSEVSLIRNNDCSWLNRDGLVPFETFPVRP